MANHKTDDNAGRRVNAYIKALMGANDTTQQELADAIGIRQASLSVRLAGRVAWRIDELEAIARYYDVPLPSLFGDDFTLRTEMKDISHRASRYDEDFRDEMHHSPQLMTVH